MAFVLALGVQGTADALTFGATRSGDLETVLVNDPFTIKFSVTLKSPVAVEAQTSKGNSTDIEYASGIRTRLTDIPHPINRDYSVIADSGYTAGDTHYYVVATKASVSRTDSAGTDVTGNVVKTTNTRNWVTEDAAYHYNNEQVSIAVTNAQITHVGSHDITDTASHTLMETGTDGSKLTTSITLMLNAGSAATVSIIVSDATPESDRSGPAAPAIPFTVFAVSALDTSSASRLSL